MGDATSLVLKYFFPFVEPGFDEPEDLSRSVQAHGGTERAEVEEIHREIQVF